MSVAAVTGLGSGIDWQKLIDEMIALDRRRTDIWERRKNDLEADRSAWSSIEAKLRSLLSAVKSLSEPQTFSKKVASASDDGVSASCTPEAVLGTYCVVVSKLAKAHIVASAAFSDAAEALGISGSFAINGREVAIDASDGLSSVAAKINQAGAGVSAYVLFEEAGRCSLVIRADETGTAGAISFEDDPASSILFALGVVDEQGAISNELQAAQDAQVQVDGRTVVRSRNEISDAVPGLTLILRRESAQPVYVEVAPDSSAARAEIESFVSAYNEASSAIAGALAKGGALQGETRLVSLWSRVRAAIAGPVEGTGGGFDRLAEIGIRSESISGTLGVDRQRLDESLSSSMEGVRELFSHADPEIFGVAEEITRTLDQALDRSVGTVVAPQWQIASRISDLDGRIDRYNRYLELRRENMRRQFVNLERTLASSSGLIWQTMWLNMMWAETEGG